MKKFRKTDFEPSKWLFILPVYLIAIIIILGSRFQVHEWVLGMSNKKNV